MKKILENPKLLLCILFSILIMPLLISQSWLGRYFPFGEGSAWLGDTMGGLTAPFIGLLSAFLVYAAFQQQVDANKLQVQANNFTQKQLHEDNVRRNIDVTFSKINHYYDSFVYSTKTKDQAIENYFQYVQLIFIGIIKIQNDDQSFMLAPNTTPKDFIENNLMALRDLSPKTRHLMVFTEISISHIQFLNSIKNRYTDSPELATYIEISIQEFTLFFLNAFRFDFNTLFQKAEEVMLDHNISGTDQVILKFIELNSLVEKHTVWM